MADADSVYKDRQALDWAFDDIIILHVEVLNSLSRADWTDAYNKQSSVSVLWLLLYKLVRTFLDTADIQS